MSVVLDQSRCIRCRACENDCAARVFSHEGDGPMQVNDQHCMHCGHCFALCPAGAITLDGHAPGSEPTVVSAPLSELQRDMLFRGRRSIRSYAPEPIAGNILTRALELASNAPTARNQREVHWTILNGREKLIPVMQEAAYQLSRTDTPYARLLPLVKKGLDPILRGAPCLILAHTEPWDWAEADCSAAITYMELALHSLGMGTCWSGIVIAALRMGPLESIPLPAGHKAYAGLMAGYPTISFRSLAPRETPDVQLID